MDKEDLEKLLEETIKKITPEEIQEFIKLSQKITPLIEKPILLLITLRQANQEKADLLTLIIITTIIGTTTKNIDQSLNIIEQARKIFEEQDKTINK